MQLSLLEWDGKTIEELTVIYNKFCLTDDFVALLLEFSTQENMQVGATWLLKHHLEMGNKTPPSLIALLSKQRLWQAKLHLLQCLPYVKIDKPEAETLYDFLQTHIKDDHKFVRAWAYNGLYELSCQYEKYLTEVIVLLEVALTDEAASVRARIRNIMKKMD